MSKWWMAGCFALAACAHGAAGGGSGGFRVFYPEQQARVHQHFEVRPAATCNYDDGREARWATTGAQVESGALPPGLAIEDGAINGVPAKAGTYHAQIAFAGVTCAGKQQPDQHVDVTLVVR